MKSKSGIVCIVLGAVLLLGALLLSRLNLREDQLAGQASMDTLPQLVQQIQERTGEESAESTDTQPQQPQESTGEDSTDPVDVPLQIPPELLTEEDKKMTEAEIDGNLYIGYLSIPAVGIELPVISTWSYPRLKIAPCRYAGSVLGEDLVIMAHNYAAHFKPISKLEIGDDVFFMDMDGNRIHYAVVGKDVLEATAVEEMTAGDFDLTLFSCTYDGSARITIYCDRLT